MENYGRNKSPFFKGNFKIANLKKKKRRRRKAIVDEIEIGSANT